MTAHDHTTIVPGCYRCDLNKDELPTPLEAAAAVISDAPAAFPSDTSTAREAIEAALDVADLEHEVGMGIFLYGSLDRETTSKRIVERIRTALLGGAS